MAAYTRQNTVNGHAFTKHKQFSLRAVLAGEMVPRIIFFFLSFKSRYHCSSLRVFGKTSVF